MSIRSTRLRGHWLRLPWGRMRVWRGGSGPALVAVHGLGGSGRYWAGLAREVGDSYAVIAPDLAGFGRSDKPRLDYDRAFHLANLDEVVRRFAGTGPVVVVGHSLGGVFATLWAAAHVERVRGLLLAAVPYPAGDGPPEWARRGPPTAFRAAARVARATWPVVGVPIGIAKGYPSAVVMDFGRQRIHSRVNTMASALWEPSVTEGLEPARALLTPVPVLLANARDDRTVPIGDQDRWATLLPHAERRMLDEGGHQFPLRTDFDALATWLRALPTRPPVTDTSPGG